MKQTFDQKMRAAVYAAAIGIAAEGILPHDYMLKSHGDICFANESRFNEAYFQQPLTDFAVGWKDPNDIEGTLNFFAPRVLVPHKFEYAEMTNAEEFLSETDDERAIGADFKSVEFTEKKPQAKTANRGLTIRIDRDQIAGDSTWELNTVARLLRRCFRNELKRALALLSAASTNTAKTWDVTAGKDPDQDVLSELVLATTASGIKPTNIGFGDTAWSKRVLAHRAQASAGGFASAGLSEAELASFLGVNKVLVSRERYQSAAAAKTEIVNNLVLMFTSMEGANIDDPTNLKRFVSETEGGGFYKVYRHEVGVKFIDVTVEYYSLIKVTSTLGARKFTIS
jgi:hypothetical protein